MKGTDRNEELSTSNVHIMNAYVDRISALARPRSINRPVLIVTSCICINNKLRLHLNRRKNNVVYLAAKKRGVVLSMEEVPVRGQEPGTAFLDLPRCVMCALETVRSLS